VRPLLRLQGGMGVQDNIATLAEADRLLGLFLSTTTGPEIEGAKAYAREIRGLLQSWTGVPPEMTLIGMHYHSTNVLTEQQVAQARRLIEGFETILFTEMPQFDVFHVEQKGISNTRALIENAENDFEEPIRSGLPPDAVKEIRQGGRAWAFDLPTASAIHIMRAAEIVLLALLPEYGISGPKKSDRNWGNYVKLLRDKGADAEMLKFLDELARFERNETIHPTKLLEPSDRDKVYTVAKGAIIIMQAEILKRKGAPVP
jgi:hypothetical protein